ncbi:MAG: 3-deoxy-D-manno-octulosonic acid transferase [Betaproteobacteria bacterium HGW-Betaproteobacteria-22]|nr:MAG: 3-deoxy-D-manno-octulosonic acid transferase [Betaproteobacteria bacterium HGW-Betaproteobacteria-22]
MTRTLYTLLLFLLLPLTPLKLLWRARKQPEYLHHWQERYGHYRIKITQPVIWLHCVSVGETRAAVPLISALLDAYPSHRILLTHTTPTGRATSEQIFGDKVARVYLPYDLPFAVKRFIQYFKPVVGVILETELWFNLIASCKQQTTPLLLVNARLSEKSARGYAKLAKLTQDGLQALSAIAAQTDVDAERLQALGAKNITITGNLKFEVTPPDNAAQQGKLLRHSLGEKRPVFLAASTREGEEEMILDAVCNTTVPDLLTVIVPRHPQRFDDVDALLKKRGFNYLRRSTLTDASAVGKEVKYILGDSMGEMFTYYAACDIAFIGGSLLPLGGQNLIEALRMGKPVLIGPHTFNFEQVCKLATGAGAAIQVQDTTELTHHINALFSHPSRQKQMSQAAQSVGLANQGATARTFKLIQPFI